MDSLTHVLIGGSISELFFEKSFGKKALLWGALAQSIPDIDFIAFLWMPLPDALMAHRGFTHSAICAMLFVFFFALIAFKIHKPHNVRFITWIYFFSTELIVHLLIDLMNNYGIGLWEPFNHERYSFNLIYVADPFFSIAFLISFIYLVSSNRFNRHRKRVVISSFVLSFVYVMYSLNNKQKVDQVVSTYLRSQNTNNARVLTTPAPFQSWLWWVVIKEDGKLSYTYSSIFDPKGSIQFRTIQNDAELEKKLLINHDFHTLKIFSQGFYHLSHCGDTAVFSDLRFGQTFGWHDSNQPFVLHYHLTNDFKNRLVIQKGRFEGWNRRHIGLYVQRIFAIRRTDVSNGK